MIEYFTNEHIDTDAISDEVRISSISSHIRLGTNILLPQVFKVLKRTLSPNSIGCVTYGSEEHKVIEKKTKKKPKKQFQNSISVDVIVTQQSHMRYPGRTSRVNMKIFSNGTVQMSGCRCGYDGNVALNTLIDRLNKRYLIIDGVTKEATITGLIEGEIAPHGLQINMVNTDLKLGYEVNREKLYSTLLEKKLQTKYDKINHAPVDLNFLIEGKEKPVHIYFFESGSVIITGSKHHDQINNALAYMHATLDPIKNDIKKITSNTVSKLALSSKYSQYVSKETMYAKDYSADVSLF